MIVTSAVFPSYMKYLKGNKNDSPSSSSGTFQISILKKNRRSWKRLLLFINGSESSDQGFFLCIIYKWTEHHMPTGFHPTMPFMKKTVLRNTVSWCPHCRQQYWRHRGDLHHLLPVLFFSYLIFLSGGDSFHRSLPYELYGAVKKFQVKIYLKIGSSGIIMPLIIRT